MFQPNCTARTGGFDWASQLRHSKKDNYPSWKILAHAPVKITRDRCTPPLRLHWDYTVGENDVPLNDVPRVWH
eukprot:COSAG02_NODE_2146_length_9670_cov_7.714136_10_plen_73_part_00